MTPKPWRPEETAQLEALLAQGLTQAKIARTMNRPAGTIAYQMSKRGWRARRTKSPVWTDVDLDILFNMHEANHSAAGIGVALGRTTDAIKCKLYDKAAHGAWRRRNRKVSCLPVAQSDWMKPLTREQLMGRRA